MKVFNGNDFLATKVCELNFSTGEKFIVKDLSDEALERITTIKEETSFPEIRQIVRLAVKAKEDQLNDTGMVELQGALNFLSESLFDIKLVEPTKED